MFSDLLAFAHSTYVATARIRSILNTICVKKVAAVHGTKCNETEQLQTNGLYKLYEALVKVVVNEPNHLYKL